MSKTREELVKEVEKAAWKDVETNKAWGDKVDAAFKAVEEAEKAKFQSKKAYVKAITALEVYDEVLSNED